MKKKETVYLDNAATSFPKPEEVNSAAYECMQKYCGNAGRGSHRLAMASAEKIFECRALLSDTFGCEPERAVFTLNTTYALNMAIKGVMSDGGHMLISNMEHNSVLRPASSLSDSGKAQYSIFKVWDGGPMSKESIMAELDSLVRPETRLIVCTHASNICSYTLPIAEIGAYCKSRKIRFCVDAAQSAGHLPINMEEMNIDILCMPSHKGLYGPQGCGVMLLGKDIDIETLIEGGNGVNSLDRNMGDLPPEKYEAGTLSTPSIAGLCEGIRAVNKQGAENISLHQKQLWMRAYEKLSKLQRVKIYASSHQGSILLFNIDGIRADEVGERLGEAGICVRAGFHCCPLGHAALGTGDGGAVRVSFGIFNTERDVDILCDEIKKIILSLNRHKGQKNQETERFGKDF